MNSAYYDWIGKLGDNPPQEQAFLKGNHTVVIAGPGSGKTRVLSLKMARLLREEIAPPQGIACLTYTRMMAAELINRLQLLGVDSTRPNIVVATVHSFCLNHVIRPFRHMYDDRLPEVIRIAPKKIRNACLAAAYKAVFDKTYDEEDRKFSKDFNTYRRQRIDIRFTDWTNKSEIAQVIQLYESYLIEQNFVDFDIITRSALSMIKQEPVVRQSLCAKFPWLAVDEYQDLGYPLYRIILELMENTPIKLFAIGDPDQCIFDFAGTDPKYLNQLSKRPDIQPVINLEKNYRSTYELIEVSKMIIGEVRTFSSSTRGGHCYVYECPNGIRQQEEQVVHLIKQYVKGQVPLQKIAILHRWRKGVNSLADHLRISGIHFVRDKHPLYDRSLTIIKWLEDLAFWCLQGCLAYAEADSNPRTTFQDIFTTWCGFQTLDQENISAYEDQRINFLRCLWKFRHSDLNVHEWVSAIEQELSLDYIFNQYEELYPDDVEEYRLLKQLTRNGQPLENLSLHEFAQLVPGVHLTTIHSSKGMEFDIVIILGVESIEETKNGRRLLYVGATRARNRLHLLYTKTPRSWTKSKYPVYPKYIKELRTKFRKDGGEMMTFANI